ncbi:MAG: 1,2-phenylacetyl-CoA epoxidase subunit PaaC [Moraxella sp.]|nr:1,2-phenylacetyl-CoA epoxidase subunit PaaC [Moraxella sp.]
MDNKNNQILANFLLHIADSQLILSHRLAQWCGHAPELEIDIALANIGLDLLGQARNFLTLAGEIEGLDRDEDKLAYHRDEREFFNLLLCEQPNGDFAQTIVRQWLFDHYQLLLMKALTKSGETKIVALAEKSLKEIKYHLRFSRTWLMRFCQSTPEAFERTQKGLNEVWRFSAELFELTQDERILVQAGIISDFDQEKQAWSDVVENELRQYKLNIPQTAYRRGAKQGLHTEHLGYILAELQYLQRTYPNMTW